MKRNRSPGLLWNSLSTCGWLPEQAAVARPNHNPSNLTRNRPPNITYAPVTNHSCMTSRSTFRLESNKEHLSLQPNQLALGSDDQKAAAESIQFICEQDEPPYLGCSLHALTSGHAKEVAHCLLSPNTVPSRFCQQHQSDSGVTRLHYSPDSFNK